jgi:hypothetical protein
MIITFYFPLDVISEIAGPEEAKNLAGESIPPDSDPLLATPSMEKVFGDC